MIQRIVLVVALSLSVVVLGCTSTGSPEVASSSGDALTRGNDYADRGMPAEAEVSYRAAIKADRANSRGYVNLAQLYIDTGRLEEAESVLADALRVNPRDVQAHNLLGNIYYSRDSYNAARRHYMTALAVDPDCYEAHWNLVATCFLLKKDDEALKHCRYYVELAPESEVRNIRRAKAYIRGTDGW